MQLNFPEFKFQIKTENNKYLIFDDIRKKYVVLTPEEWVRQHTLKQLEQNKFPKGRISVERSLNNSTKRYDVIFYNAHGDAELLIECKSPQIQISQKTIDQVAGYITIFKCTKCSINQWFITHFHSEKIRRITNCSRISHFFSNNKVKLSFFAANFK